MFHHSKQDSLRCTEGQMLPWMPAMVRDSRKPRISGLTKCQGDETETWAVELLQTCCLKSKTVNLKSDFLPPGRGDILPRGAATDISLASHSLSFFPLLATPGHTEVPGRIKILAAAGTYANCAGPAAETPPAPLCHG